MQVKYEAIDSENHKLTTYNERNKKNLKLMNIK